MWQQVLGEGTCQIIYLLSHAANSSVRHEGSVKDILVIFME